ncbi:MAG: imidazole glycerol phosphate synthase subunit HisH [Candidatus Omnitrophota bacterium]|nr:MAG: imidazole glycerol phosphate synthase subunit HisH [Candidatus Omnitrophota bacterium]
MSIVIVDYGMGNLASVYNALKFLGENAKIAALPADIEKADKLILPGVGAFQDAMLGMKERGFIESLTKFLSSGKAYLGICLGLQVLFQTSEEGAARGLGVFKGKVKRFRKEDGVKVPHIGWNSVKLKHNLKLTAGLADGSYFYFDHSYYVEPENKDIVAATTNYGRDFASFICKDNIFAVQFHPERSQELGLKLLENFIRL